MRGIIFYIFTLLGLLTNLYSQTNSIQEEMQFNDIQEKIQTDNIQNQIFNYKKTQSEIIAKGRMLLLDKFLVEDFKKIKEIFKYIKHPENKTLIYKPVSS